MAAGEFDDRRLRRRSGNRFGIATALPITACWSLFFGGAFTLAPASASAGVWFVRANASGDGTSAANPLGSSQALEAVTRAGDLIVLLGSNGPLDGGIALKPGQTLVGQTEGGKKPTITNSNAGRHGGSGVVLADDCKVVDVRIERTRASGVVGVDVSGTCLLGVDVESANQAGGLTTTKVSLLGPIAHAGVLFITLQPTKPAENRLWRCSVEKATGIGIGAFALKGARSRLVISHTRIEGGTLIAPLFDMGLVAFADGKASVSAVEIADCVVSGRMSQQGRNILAFAAALGDATVRIERSVSGAVGQDGVVGVAAMVPATVKIEIRDSTLEKAGQMNLEGTILDLPPSDQERAHESLVSIDVERTLIRGAGFVDGFRGEAQNIWLAPSILEKGPFAQGQYRLAIRDSIIEKALKGGITVGNSGADFKIGPDEGAYEISLRGNTIRDNGNSEISIAAANARIDARQNFWGTPAGLAAERISLLGTARRSQLDASDPLAQQSERSRPR
jgi:hypothetical protein